MYLGIVGPALLAAVLQGRTVLSRCQDIASQALHRFRQSLASEAPLGWEPSMPLIVPDSLNRGHAKVLSVTMSGQGNSHTAATCSRRATSVGCRP